MSREAEDPKGAVPHMKAVLTMTTTDITTVRGDEIARFNRLASTWWNPHGPMRPLHVVNTHRLGYVLEQVSQRFGRSVGDLQGLRIADIGCGAGLMCEPLAMRGAEMIGIDAAEKNVAAARLHAGAGDLAIDYRVGEPGSALREGDRFDVMLLLEVVEHVDDVAAFVAQAAKHLKPGGLLLASTINRTWRSWLLAIVGAEHVLRVLPVGTHHWRQLVRPDELTRAAASAGLRRVDQRGMRYLPVVHRASWTADLSVNYIASFVRD